MTAFFLWLGEHALVATGGICALVVLAILLAPRRPPPVVGRLLPHHDPNHRPRFESKRPKESA